MLRPVLLLTLLPPLLCLDTPPSGETLCSRAVCVPPDYNKMDRPEWGPAPDWSTPAPNNNIFHIESPGPRVDQSDCCQAGAHYLPLPSSQDWRRGTPGDQLLHEAAGHLPHQPQRLHHQYWGPVQPQLDRQQTRHHRKQIRHQPGRGLYQDALGGLERIVIVISQAVI